MESTSESGHPGGCGPAQECSEAPEADFGRAVSIDKALLGDANHQTATANANLARVLMEENEYDRAAPLLREAVKALTEPPRSGQRGGGGRASCDNLLGAEDAREGREIPRGIIRFLCYRGSVTSITRFTGRLFRR